MSKVVYAHIVSSYGRKPGVWFALFTEALRAFIGRVVTVVLLANMVAAVSRGDFEAGRMYIMWWAVLTVIVYMLAGLGELAAIRSENDVYADQLKDYYTKLTNKDMAFYRDNHTGSLTAMFRQYLDNSLLLVRMIRRNIVPSLVTLLFPTIVMFSVSWEIGCIALVLVLTQIVYMVWASAKSNEYRMEAYQVYKEISGEVSDDIANIVAYKTAGKEKEALTRMVALRERETDAFWNRGKMAVYLDFPRMVLTVVLVGAAFWIILSSTSATSQTIGTLVLTITYMFQILRTVGDVPDLLHRHDDLISKLEPTLQVMSTEHETIKDAEKPIRFKPTQGEILLSNLTFRYGDDMSAKPVFKNLTIHIKGGEKVGIVGLSGAGKSTLASLLMRFDDAVSGEITIDGINIKDVAQSDLRQKIAYVPQEPILFHRTIRENIAYHNSSATDKDIINAAKAAHAHEFISVLPKGYNTIVGERGVKLSGGQKQRVVIARAVLKKAPILIFDEATSALDSESEVIIKEAMPAIMGNHTAIIIAHRLSTIADLDRIIVLESGKIAEEGTHATLIKNKGRYASLWKSQSREL